MNKNDQGEGIGKALERYHAIYIWMPVGVSQVGHASLRLSNGEYVSWWPQGKTAKCGLKKKVSKCICSLKQDIEEEGMDPDYTYIIPSKRLDLSKMTAFWNKQKDTGHYSLLTQNCCWAVYQVLHAGGSPMSLTLVWRPETLRRYLVIYLGGGSSHFTALNMPRLDFPFKEKITLHTWKAWDETVQHRALSLDYSVYVSWWPRTSQAAGYAAFSLAEDRAKMGRVEDDTYIIPDHRFELHLMRRAWKKMVRERKSEMWGVSSDWVIQEIMLTGGASRGEIFGKYDSSQKLVDLLCLISLYSTIKIKE